MRPRLVVVGPVTPPITGMVAVTRAMVDEFVGRGAEVTVLDVSRRQPWLHAFRKPGKYLLAAALIRRLARRGPVTLYMPVNSGAGIRLNRWLLGLVRDHCAGIVLHHHTFGYLERHDGRIDRLCRIGGARALHLGQCPRMAERLRALYGEDLRCLSVSNAAWIEPSPGREAGGGPDECLTLGHLSNLGRRKGLHAVVHLARRCRGRGLPVRLVLAGPAGDDEAAGFIDEIMASDGDWIDYRGPVYGEDKARFFESIDCFVFPSQTETEGIVTLEALAYGRPVLALAVGCIPDRLGGTEACLVVPPGEDFVARAADWLAPLFVDRERLRARSVAARRRLETIRRQALEDLSVVLGEVVAP